MIRVVCFLLLLSGICYGQHVDRFTRFQTSATSDAITVLSPVIYYTPNSIVSGGTDGSTVTLWSDTSGNGHHATPSGTGNIVLNIGTSNQVEFNGTTYFDVPDVAALDFDIGTDNFTLIVREGDVRSTTSGYLISKAEGTGSNREYGIYYINSGSVGLYLGGSSTTPAITANNNRLHIMIVTGSNYEYWVDGVLEASGTLGSNDGAGSQSVNIGGRTDGSYLMNSGSMLDRIAIVPSAISTGERTAIETEFQFN